jgi:hypothetical protein
VHGAASPLASQAQVIIVVNTDHLGNGYRWKFIVSLKATLG